MRRPAHAAATLSLLLIAGTAAAVDTTLTPGGYTGLGITPNAHLIGWGRVEFGYDNQIPGLSVDPTGHNFVLGFGLLPNLEVTGRIAASELNSSCFTGCGRTRDLSASVKAGIGLDAGNRFRVAAGVADFGGAATNFRTYYGVLTFNEGPFELSGGYARRSTGNSPLDGPFAAAAWQPLPWVRGQVEYADSNAWAGVRLFAPKEWLPEGWAAHVGANFRLTDTDFTRRSWWTAGLSIPLYKVPTLQPKGTPRAPLPQLEGAQQPLPAYEARALPPAAVAAPAQPLPVPYQGPTDEDLRQLAEALKAKGLEDISVGRMADTSIAVRANNATYNWNSTDALGAGLGAIANVLGAAKTSYRFVLMQRQIPIVAVTGQADCLRQWIQGEDKACAAGELSTPGTSNIDALHAGATWLVQGLQPSNRTVRVALTPVLRTNVATELGVLDYSAGVNIGFKLPVWAGADVEWRVDQEIASSDDYKPGGAFGARRIQNGTERLAFTQTLRLPVETWVAPGDDVSAKRWGLNAVTAQATIGRVARNYDGVIGSLRWEPGEGAHRVSLQAGYFSNNDFGAVPGEPKTARPLLVDYRYHLTATRTYLEATGGQFMRNDRGVQIGLRQWFGDLSVGAYYRRTQFGGASAANFVGMELTLPIGPRRDMNPGGVQVTGTPRFSHSIYTAVSSATNAVASGVALLPPVPNLESVFNSDRAGLLYFEDNIRRIRDAAR
jgi:hypothetical protein